MGYLRQHSRYCDLRHLKALGWMVSALICSGQLNLAAWEPYVPLVLKSPKHRAAVAEIHEQRPDSSRSAVSAVSDGGLERVATRAGLFGIRHGPVGSLLYDSSVGGLLGERFPYCGECWSTIAPQLPSVIPAVLRKRAGYAPSRCDAVG